jgi:hypothetical protein
MSSEPTESWVLLKPEGRIIAIPINRLSDMIGCMKLISSEWKKTGIEYKISDSPLDMQVMTADQMAVHLVRSRVLDSAKAAED